jgi:ADP-ribose pyrophosphatase YjhB (NUDIX family)
MTGLDFPVPRLTRRGKSNGFIRDWLMMRARFDPPYPVVGVSIAVFREGRVLLATRTKPPFAGVFTLPGGHVEAGESLEAAALRELREEVGVEARVIAFNKPVEVIAPENEGIGRHYVILSFVGAWLQGEGTSGPEAGEILWADREQLAQLTTSPQLIAVVERARTIMDDAMKAERASRLTSKM